MIDENCIQFVNRLVISLAGLTPEEYKEIFEEIK